MSSILKTQNANVLKLQQLFNDLSHVLEGLHYEEINIHKNHNTLAKIFNF
jgi:hypothetical protein